MALHLKTTTFLCGLLLAAGALAQAGSPLQSVEQADANLAQVKQDRAAVEAEFAAAEAVCYKKFFVNNCLDKAKETRRVRLAQVRTMEIDANYFKRKNTVDVRDRELEDRAQRDAAEQASHAANPPKPHANPADRAAPVPQKVLPAQRQAEHDARERQRDAAATAKAAERAQSVKDFAAKQADATARQQKVAEKKADRAARQARRQAEAAAKAAADAEKAKQKVTTK